MVTTNSAALAKVANSPGRLMHEFNIDPKSVVMKVNDALHKAALVMGLNPDAKTLAITASEAVKKILDVYPHAPVDDVTLAISMASYGEIKLDNQLTTISALNIYQWYKQFRYEHSNRSTIPAKPSITGYSEPSIEQKRKLVRDGFVNFVTNPTFHDLTLDFQYRKLVDIGAFEPSTTNRVSARPSQEEGCICLSRPIQSARRELDIHERTQGQCAAQVDCRQRKEADGHRLHVNGRQG